MKTFGAHIVSLFLALSWFSYLSEAYRPVIIVHGIFDGPKQFETLVEFIQKAHPGTEVTTIDLYDDLSSVKPLWTQVKDFRAAIEKIMDRSEEGVHLLCFSQGGLICRALLSVIPNHNVHTFIALSSPLAGQYGGTDYLKRLFPKYVKKNLYKICYTKVGQKVSICQYWNVPPLASTDNLLYIIEQDPHHRDKFLKSSNFLALLNGDSSHKDSDVWRDNFLRIKKLVLIGGPNDGVITPWQSSMFGFYNSSEAVVQMRNQEFYIKDLFGLKTLDSRGDVSLCVQSGVSHITWHSNYTVFSLCIQEWLI